MILGGIIINRILNSIFRLCITSVTMTILSVLPSFLLEKEINPESLTVNKVDEMVSYFQRSKHSYSTKHKIFKKEELPLNLTILYTNDTHSHLENDPYLFSAIKLEKKQNPSALLLDAGDVFSGTLFFTEYLGQADAEFMNEIGYDAMTLGNHEFDKSSKILADFIKEASFPIVSSNVDVENDEWLSPLKENDIGEPGRGGEIYPAIIRRVNGVKVGIIGVTTEDTTFLSSPSKKIKFENAEEKTRETILRLQEKDVNHIIMLSHLGLESDKALAQKVKGIDVIVGGHSHTKLSEPLVYNESTEPTLIVQANEYAKYLGKLQASFDSEGVLISWKGKLIDVLKKDENGNYVYPPDEWAVERLAELTTPIEKLMYTVIGSTEVQLNGDRSDVRTKETNLGNLITDAMRDKANHSLPTQVALQNGGGIRDSINKGEITLGEILTVLPFGDTLVTLDLTGEEILAALEHSVAKVDEEAGQFLQVSGLTFRFDPSQPVGERVYNVNLLTAGGAVNLDPNRLYTVATNAFLADGGDGFIMFKDAKDEGRMTELYYVDYEVMSEYIKKNSPISPKVEGRIIEGVKPGL